MSAFEAAVPVFGWGQVSTYILAGLGDTRDAILTMCSELIARGVYPFVVPFVPISGTPLEDHPTPPPAFMHDILEPLAAMLRAASMTSANSKAGCAKCGACSGLASYERADDRSVGLVRAPSRAWTPPPSVDLVLEGAPR
jgi:biotin synthase-related radical SAM superfamily protein